MNDRKKKARNDVALLLVFMWLLSLILLHIGLEPRRYEVVALVSALSVVVLAIFTYVGQDRGEPHPSRIDRRH